MRNPASLNVRLISIIFILAFLLFTPKTAIAQPVQVPVQKIEKSSNEIAFASPTIKRICSCESTGRPGNEPQQFLPNGSIVRGRVNHLDVGACQINLKYHAATAAKLGYDLYSKDGNIEYANYLYRSQGTTPWNPSRRCWAS